MARHTIRTFWLSDESWEALGGLEEKPLRVAGGQNLSRVSPRIEAGYQEWVTHTLVVKDEALVELIAARVAQGRYGAWGGNRGGIYDHVLWSAAIGSWARQPHGLTLTQECVDALADWTDREKVWRTQRKRAVVALAGSALELIARGWISD